MIAPALVSSICGAAAHGAGEDADEEQGKVNRSIMSPVRAGRVAIAHYGLCRHA